MKIVHVVPRFAVGGAERLAMHLLVGLAEAGQNVQAISLYDRCGTDIEKVLESQGIPVAYLGKRPGVDVRILTRLWEQFKIWRPDVVHTHQYVLRYVFLPAALQRIPGIVHTVHSIAEREVDAIGKVVHHVAFRSGVVPVAIADQVATSLRRVYGKLEYPVIPNGIPVHRYRARHASRVEMRRALDIPEDDVVFISVGRLAPPKNPMFVLDGFENVVSLDGRAHIILVGEGPLLDVLRERIHKAGHERRVRLLGLRSDIPDLLNAADVYVQGSDWEGNPLAIMEAMAAGLPVIATRVGGIPELVESGTHGILVEPRNVEALTGAMHHLMNNPGLRRWMGQCSAQKAHEEFDRERMAQEYLELYRTMVRQQRQKGIASDGEI